MDIRRGDDHEEDFDSCAVSADGSSRYRPEVVAKDKYGCCAMLMTLMSYLIASCYNLFRKCGICQDDPNDDLIPPKRYIYFGSAYDIKNNVHHGNKTTVRSPHIESEIDDDQIGSEFVSNYISTSKYTRWTFLPINLFQQFRKKANIYILLQACIDFAPNSFIPFIYFSPNNFIPLLFILIVNAIKEGYEDYQRYKKDREINKRQVDVFRPDMEGKNWCFKKLAWEEIQVGDMIRITKDTKACPADLLLLQSSRNQGLCMIDTANLDGETTPKSKQAVGATYSLPTDEDGNEYPFNEKLQFKLESEGPYGYMTWKGTLYMNSNGDNDGISVGTQQFLPRCCELRKTDWIIGVVVFTGVETKISLNQVNDKRKLFKRSTVYANDCI